MIFAKKKRIPILILVAISLCGSLQPTVADRDVGDQRNYLKRLLDKRAEKKKKKIEEKQQQRQQPNQYPYDHIGSQTTTTKSGNSLLARSFILACMFWTIKLAMPQMRRYIVPLCRDITQFRRSLRHQSKELQHRRKKKSSHVDEETPRRKHKSQSSKKEDSERRDHESISPSVLSIIEMGNANDDDGSSFISATSSFFSQIARSRRRKPKKNSTEGSAESTPTTHTKSKQSSSSSKSSSRSKKKSHPVDVEKGITKSKLHFIEEEHDTTKPGNDTNGLDDISHLPIVGNIKKPEDGYGLLERKVSSGSDKKHSSHGKKWHR